MIKATMERSSENDPRELRKLLAEKDRRIAELERSRPTVEKIVEVPVLKNGQLGRTEKVIMRTELIAHKLLAEASELRKVVATASATRPAAPIAHRMPTPIPPRPSLTPSAEPAPGSPGGGLRRMLVALAQRPQGLSATQLGIRSQLSSKSGTFDTYLGRGRQSGWIVGSRSHLQITQAGIDALGHYDALPMGKDLLAYWINELGGGAARMLDVLANMYPRSISADEVAEHAGLSGKSGTFNTYLGRLRRLELVEGQRGALRASEELFS
jgi:hypothetical protein